MGIPLPNIILSASKFGLTEVGLLMALIVCLVFSAFFSASETAYSTANAIRMRNYVDEKRKGARKALYIMEHYDKTLATILVGNNFVNIASTTICAIIFGKLIVNPTLASVLNTVIMTIVVLIFGEILPKSFAKASAEKIALKFSGFLFVVIKIMYPITFFFLQIQKLMLKRVKADDNPTVTEDELESIIDTMEEEGVLDENDANIFQGVMDLDDQQIYDIMTPRVDVTAIEINASSKDLQDIFLHSGFSRIPIYENDKDHMIGIVHVKDFVNKVLNNDTFTIKEIMAEPIFVAENMKAKDLIRKMQQEKKHMAIVIDEYGGTSGIVTFEDVMEEMLGDIYDEHDNEIIIPYITKISENEYDVNPDINLDDLFDSLEIEHMPDTEYSNLGGYLYELAENLPEVDQKLEVVTVDEQMDDHGNMINKTIKIVFTITEIEDRRIKRVRATVIPEVTDEVPEEKHLRKTKKSSEE